MNLQDDDFALLGLPRKFSQDDVLIDERWKLLQRQAHPDKFVMQSASAQRQALQWSVRINEARQRLKDPVSRAAYLCELHGQPIEAESNTAMPIDFLVQQMQWREALDEADDAVSLKVLEKEVQQMQQQAVQTLEQNIDQERDFAAAAQQVRRMKFMLRFAQDVKSRLP